MIDTDGRAPFQRVGVVAKGNEPAIAGALTRIGRALVEHGCEVTYDTEAATLLGSDVASVARNDLAKTADVIVVLGGDGTLLSVAPSAAAASVPVLGINYGSLGFLTATVRDEAEGAIDDMMRGKFVVHSRMMLRARVEPDSTDDPQELHVRDVLNDAVVNKTSLARIVQLEVIVDGDFVSRYRADGLIAATPTGSTAYSLAAGGPIVMPEVEAIVVSPISPHTLANRPLVLPGSAEITVRLLSEDQDIVLTLDGQVGVPVHPGEIVRVCRSPHRFDLLLTGERSYFEVLRTKLKWGDR